MGRDIAVQGIHLVVGHEFILMGIGLQIFVAGLTPVGAQVVELLPHDSRQNRPSASKSGNAKASALSSSGHEQPMAGTVPVMWLIMGMLP